MNSSKPYLLRALYEWIVDNDCTPHVLVAMDLPGVQVPEGYGENGQMVLNVAPSAVRYLSMENDALSFEARFAGVARQIVVPMYAVLAVYARENGQGMFFDADIPEMEESTPESVSLQVVEQEEPLKVTPPASGRPSLKIIK